MIVPMRRIVLVVRSADREPLIRLLREVGVVHVVPIRPDQAVPDEAAIRQAEAIKSAIHVLKGVEASGSLPEISPLEAAGEVLDIQQRSAEGRNRLVTLYHQLEQIAIWDGLRLDYVDELRRAGINLRFFALPENRLQDFGAACATEVSVLPDGRILVAVADQLSEINVPAEVEPIPLPPRDTAMIKAEARVIDESLRRDMERLSQLSHLTKALKAESSRLERQLEDTIVVRGAATDEHMFAIQGWLPQENVSLLESQLERHNMLAALKSYEPIEYESPPTLIRTPAWARPIEGLFSMLGTVPGYREFDVSGPFLIALPIFTAMLISDAGYGALILFGPMLAYRWAAANVGKRFPQLLMIVGAVSVLWGALTNAFFGFQLLPVTLIPIELTDQSRNFMMRLSFVIGATHLSLAQIWSAVRFFPDLRSLNRLGWALFIWGMYGVVNMFVLQGTLGWQTPWPYLLSSGATLAILFANPSPNLAKMIGIGFAQFPLSMLSAFSDVISYVRLMAVGLASSVLATSFNEMAYQTEFLPITILVLVLGHGLNIGLALIAMFAHGVRLNMLEFGSNLGMEWIGYPYKPFTK